MMLVYLTLAKALPHNRLSVATALYSSIWAYCRFFPSRKCSVISSWSTTSRTIRWKYWSHCFFRRQCSLLWCSWSLYWRSQLRWHFCRRSHLSWCFQFTSCRVW